MEERGVCLEQEVERLRGSGMSAREIAARMGVDAAWVESLLSMWETRESAGSRDSGRRAL